MKIPVILVPRGDVLRPSVVLVGNYDRPGWKLYAQGFSLLGRLPDPTAFKVFTLLSSALNRLTLTAVGPKGEAESEEIMIAAPDAQEFRISPSWGEGIVSLGVGSYSYFQTGYGTFSSTPLLLRLTYTTPKWASPLGIYAEVQSSVFTLSSFPQGLTPQIVYGKLEGTYLLGASPLSTFRFSLSGGVTYLTMFSNGSPFGFSNLLGPIVGMRTYYILSANSGFTGKVDYAPLASPFDFTQRGIEAKVGWTTRLSNAHRIEFDLTLSNYYLLEPDNVTKIQSNLWGLTLGYSL